mgnify:CR=1 FL=1
MPKISLIKKTSGISQIFLGAQKVCLVNDCGYEQGCAGKNSRRDNDFTCDLSELIVLYRTAAKKEKQRKKTR